MDNTSLKSHPAAPGEEKGGRAILQLNCKSPNQRGNGHGSLKLHWNTGFQNNPIPHISVIGSHHYLSLRHLFLQMLSKIQAVDLYMFMNSSSSISHTVFLRSPAGSYQLWCVVLRTLLIDSSWRATRVGSQLFLKSRQHRGNLSLLP